MDEYLKTNASYNRLVKEYEQYGSLVIAYDFDNTVYDFHKKGETYIYVIKLLQRLKRANCHMICFTANTDYEVIVKYLNENDIPCDTINQNPPFFQSSARKIYFNALLDDRAGLLQVYTELIDLLHHFKID